MTPNELKRASERQRIRVHVVRRTPGHITLAVFCRGKCGELTIGVGDEALFREAFPVTWVERIATRDERFLDDAL